MDKRNSRDKGNSKNCTKNIRFSQKEINQITKEAQKHHMTFSEYIRRKCLDDMMSLPSGRTVDIAAQVKANEQVNQVYRIVKDSGNEQLLKQITIVLRKMKGKNGQTR